MNGYRPARRRRRGNPETKVQKAVLESLRYHPRVAWVERSNSGVILLDKGLPTERRMRMGWKGCSDLLGQLKDGRLLAVEVKGAGGRLTPEQRDFLDLVRSNRGVSGVVFNADQAMQLVNAATAGTE